jgi:hypothetical protein
MNPDNIPKMQKTTPDRASYYKQWEEFAKKVDEASAAHDWSKHDFSKLTAKDVSVVMGPPLTEEEFLAMRKKRGMGNIRTVQLSSS